MLRRIRADASGVGQPHCVRRGARGVAVRSAQRRLARPHPCPVAHTATPADGRPGAHGCQLRRAHRVRPARLPLPRSPIAACTHRRDGVRRLRDRAQRRLCRAVGRVGPVPLLRALGPVGRGSLPHRVQHRADLLGRPLRARRREPARRPDSGRVGRGRAVAAAGRRGPGRDWWSAYLAASAMRRTPLRLGGLTLPMPSARIAGAQLALSSTDWLLAALALYVLLPAGAPPLPSSSARTWSRFSSAW